MKLYRPALLVLALLTITSLLVLWMPAPQVSNRLRVRMPLPDTVNAWTGNDILFCQDESCMKGFRVDAMPDRRHCPVCQASTHPLALAERKALPSDTLLSRKQYTRFGSSPILVTVVVSGSERTGIHRPQMCLTGQGWGITGSRVVSVDVPDRGSLPVMLLDVARTVRTGPGASPIKQEAAFAYWFTDPSRETPYHLERMFWMAFDSVFHATLTRWAYITVLLPNAGSSTQTLEDFIGELYPLIVEPAD